MNIKTSMLAFKKLDITKKEIIISELEECLELVKSLRIKIDSIDFTDDRKTAKIRQILFPFFTALPTTDTVGRTTYLYSDSRSSKARLGRLI